MASKMMPVILGLRNIGPRDILDSFILNLLLHEVDGKVNFYFL
jgi:hypothetical protein